MGHKFGAPLTAGFAAFVALAFLLPSMEATAAADIDAPVKQQHAPDVIVLPPLVEFIAMETDKPIEAPRADRDVLSMEIAESFVAHLSEQGNAARFVNITGVDSAADGVSPKALFDIIRGKNKSEDADQIRAYLADSFPDSAFLLIRTRFYLDYWGRSGRGWQVATTILTSDRSGKRMVIDARLYSRGNFDELWRGLKQERITPRASRKGIDRAVRALSEEMILFDMTMGENDDG